MTQKLTGWGALALLAIAIAWLAFSPYWTLSVLKTATEERDAAVINEHIDYPLLRESLKSELLANMRKEMAERSVQMEDTGPNMFGSNMEQLGLVFVNGMIDTIVRPESVEALIERAKQQNQVADAKVAPDKVRSEDDFVVDRTGLKSFEIRDKKTNAAILFNLDGFTWKIVGARTPKQPANS